MKSVGKFFLICLFGAATTAAPQTGAIAGRVQTADQGAPLPGANIVLVGSHLGATTDANGFYLIANVPAGSYQVRATFVGFIRTTAEDVRVRPNLTTMINFKLQEETLEGEAVTVVAKRHTINPEVSSSLADVDAEDLKSLPLTTIEEAIRLQPGVEPDLTIRGGNLNTVSFLVDGLNLREGRTHAPITGLSFTALEQMQVQTGGFNAEYGNVRSGLVQLVTKNPPADRYLADFLVRYRPSQRLSFAGSVRAAGFERQGLHRHAG
ncbi:MAG: TonB-dependent receptor [candidate division KSB1 bacterium]|nr:TonB-dependent receptor [candidate division KSB1 bacterium]MDZ7364845.1 TonB-dependent receptor [candidate division KSB1 bacterium]MDZ7402948.1 TonB-dependent receptor [candidate division KSB1 bacterium]